MKREYGLWYFSYILLWIEERIERLIMLRVWSTINLLCDNFSESVCVKIRVRSTIERSPSKGDNTNTSNLDDIQYHLQLIKPWMFLLTQTRLIAETSTNHVLFQTVARSPHFIDLRNDMLIFTVTFLSENYLQFWYYYSVGWDRSFTWIIVCSYCWNTFLDNTLDNTYK